MAEKPTTIRYIKENIARYDFRFKKELGQNFLIDENIIRKIIAASDIAEDDNVLEIGPGMGSLTYFLAQTCKELLVVEKDRVLTNVIKKNFHDVPHLTILNEDILTFDFQKLPDYFSTQKKIKVISNLPYSITSAVIMKLLQHGNAFDTLTLMMQKEVAQRLLASPSTKDYGSLTLAVQYYAECTPLFNVPSHVFFPRPTIDSTVVLLKLRAQPPVSTSYESEMFSLIRAAFSTRRKTLINSLHHQLHFDKNVLLNALKQLDIDIHVRGEALTLTQFAALTEILHDK